MKINLDSDSLMTVKQLYDNWQQANQSAQILIEDANSKKRALDNYVQQLTQLNGINKNEYVATEWELDLKTGILSKKVQE